jgi:acetate kinase
MGFTPTDGLVMAPRSGTLDPGAVVWLQGDTDEDLGRVLEQESGLLGLCGTGDMREVLDRRAAGDAGAALAFAVWLHRFVTLLGGCVAALQGLDALVFTGGIGERSAPVRAAVAQELGWLGVAVDEGGGAPEISAAGARVRTFVVPAREDLQLAAEALAAIGAG